MPKFKGLHADDRRGGVFVGRFNLSSGVETTQTFAGLGLPDMADTTFIAWVMPEYTNVSSSTNYPRVRRWTASRVVIGHGANEGPNPAVILQIAGRATNMPE